ncbi:MAG: gliding motility-associated C-terminal domain-containing protein [Bacteroidota bacterium]|nr:gliding motility-associated C-terminal domain-containing protein [Bacteroidota bacterium]
MGHTLNGELFCESDSEPFIIDSLFSLPDSTYIDPNVSTNILFGDTLNSGWTDTFPSLSGGFHNIVLVNNTTSSCWDIAQVYCPSQYQIRLDDAVTLTHVMCNDSSDGRIDIDINLIYNANLSTIPNDNLPYSIDFGGIDNTALTAGTYSVTVTDDSNCSYTTSYTIEEPEPFIINDSLTHPCTQPLGAIDLEVDGGNPGGYSYSWSNGATTQDLSNLLAGTYTLTVTDANNCQETFDFSLIPPFQVDLGPDVDLVCIGELTLIEAHIIGGSSSSSMDYQWFDVNGAIAGAISPQISLGAGTYSVTVTDPNGCASTDLIEITQPASLIIQADTTNISCYGSDGSITINPQGGTPPYTYLWSNGDTTSNINNLSTGSYIIEVTDSCGFSVIETFTLYDYEVSIEVAYNSFNNSATVLVNSSTTPSSFFDYSWLTQSGELFSITQTTSGLCQDTYLITATDEINGCTSNEDTLIVEYYLPLGIVDMNTSTVLVDSLLWGSAPYTYEWSTGEVTAHAYVCQGDHWVEVYDINDCMVREDFTIEDLIITLDPAAAILECNLENLAIDLEASATGGVGTYSFQWSNGSTENPMDLELNPGNFGVTVTDANGCTEDTSFVIAAMTAECIPNVFTPNGDSQNDTWNLEDTFLYEDSEVRVYNRFGRLIFESVGYHQPWNGTNKRGKDMSDGVYFYSIDIGHGFEQINGTVTILR